MDTNKTAVFLCQALIRLKKTACLYSLILFAVFVFPSHPQAATAKHAKVLKVGEEVLSHIIAKGGPGFPDTEQLKGKTTIMVFAAADQEFSWKALQDLQKILDDSKEKKIQTIAVVSAAQGRESVEKLIKRLNLSYRVIHDEQGLAARLKVLVYPTTLIIDRTGRLAYYYSLYSSNYHDEISTRLKKTINDQAQGYINAAALQRELKEKIQNARQDIENGNVRSAVTDLNKLIQTGEDPYLVHLLLGYASIKLNEPQKALSYFKKASEKQPNSIRASMGMGIAYSRAGKTEEALTILTKIVPNGPESFFVYRELSHIFEKQNRMDKALYYIKKELDSIKD